MNIEELKLRFKKFAIEVAMLIQQIPKNTISIAYCNQLIRCSSSHENPTSEGRELLAITVQSIKTARLNHKTQNDNLPGNQFVIRHL